MSHLNRQRRVNATLKQSLSDRELPRVTAFFAFTPTEVRVMEQEAALSL